MGQTVIVFLTGGASPVAQTGNSLVLLMMILASITFVSLGFIVYQLNFKKLSYSSIKTQLQHLKAETNFRLLGINFSSKKSMAIASILGFLIVLSMCAIFWQTSVYADANKASNTETSKTIYARLDSNNNLIIDDAYVANQSDKSIDLYGLKLSKKTVNSDTSTWKIINDQNILYNDIVGKYVDLPTPIIIKPHESSKLSISSNMTADEARRLNGESFIIEYSIKDTYEYAIEPSVSPSSTYTGEEIVGVMGNETINLTGDWKATDAGTYKAYATPVEGLTWPDKTTDTKVYTWTIEKAVPEISLGQDIIDLNKEQTKNISFDYNGDGEINIELSTTDVADAKVNAGNLILYGKDSGRVDGAIKCINGHNYYDTSIEFSAYVTKVYTGRIYFPLFDDYGLFNLFAYSKDLYFEWNPYRFINGNNNEYSRDIALLALAFNDDCLDGTHIYLDGVDEWTIFDNETFYKVLGMQDVERIYINPDDYDFDKNDTSMFVASHYSVKVNGRVEDFMITTVAGTDVMQRNDIGSDLDVGTCNSPETYTLAEHPEWLDYNHHKGFDVSYRRDSIKIKDYVSRNIDINSNKTILFTGHSKGGAICNFLGEEFELNPDYKSYAYCFATPAVTDGPTDNLSTIYNIISECDLVPQVPPAEWGFHRLGVDKKANFLDDIYQTEWKKRIAGHPFVDVGAKAILDELLKLAPTRDDLYKFNFNKPFRYETFGSDISEAEQYIKKMMNFISEYKLGDCIRLSDPLLDPDWGVYYVNVYCTSSYITMYLTNIINTLKDEGLIAAGEYAWSVFWNIGFPEQYYDLIQKFLNNIDVIIPGFMCNHSDHVYYMLPWIDKWNN